MTIITYLSDNGKLFPCNKVVDWAPWLPPVGSMDPTRDGDAAAAVAAAAWPVDDDDDGDVGGLRLPAVPTAACCRRRRRRLYWSATPAACCSPTSIRWPRPSSIFSASSTGAWPTFIRELLAANRKYSPHVKGATVVKRRRQGCPIDVKKSTRTHTHTQDVEKYKIVFGQK